MLLGTLGANLLGNNLAGKGMNIAEERVIRAENGAATKRHGKVIARAFHGCHSLNKADFYCRLIL